MVATTAARAAAGTGDVWDSGEVSSDRNTAVYAGPALASRTRYYWSVRSWTGPARVRLGARRLVRDGLPEPVGLEGHVDLRARQRLAVVPTAAQGTADDDCCVQGTSTLSAPAAAGEHACCASSVTANFFAGKTRHASTARRAESATIESVGAANTHDGRGPVSAGDTNVKVASVANFAPGAPLTIGGETVSILERRHGAGAATTLFAAAAGGRHEHQGRQHGRLRRRARRR